MCLVIFRLVSYVRSVLLPFGLVVLVGPKKEAFLTFYHPSDYL